VDTIAVRLLKDGVPFVTRSNSLYVMVPGGITLQLIGPLKSIYSEDFHFCRRTGIETARLPRYPQNFSTVQSIIDQPIKTMLPSHQSFAVSNASENMEWLATVLNVPERLWTASGEVGKVVIKLHRYARGECAKIEWAGLGNGFSFHFVQQYYKRDGGLSIKQHEQFMGSLPLNEPHAFQAMHVGLVVDDVRTLNHALISRAQRSYYQFADDLTHSRFRLPSGYIINAYADVGGFQLSHAPTHSTEVAMPLALLVSLGISFFAASTGRFLLL